MLIVNLYKISPTCKHQLVFSSRKLYIIYADVCKNVPNSATNIQIHRIKMHDFSLSKAINPQAKEENILFLYLRRIRCLSFEFAYAVERNS